MRSGGLHAHEDLAAHALLEVAGLPELNPPYTIEA
jgi:hypothetical protein